MVKIQSPLVAELVLGRKFENNYERKERDTWRMCSLDDVMKTCQDLYLRDTIQVGEIYQVDNRHCGGCMRSLATGEIVDRGDGSWLLAPIDTRESFCYTRVWSGDSIVHAWMCDGYVYISTYAKTSTVELQSGEDDQYMGSMYSKMQVMSMRGNDKPYVVDASGDGDDEMRGITDMPDADLGKFLERPVKIQEFLWSPSITFFQEFDPWSLFLENKRVINRIANYKLLRGKLKLKFVINGNSFYYGRMLASYLPLDVYDDLSISSAFIREDAVAETVRPHIFLDPTMSQGGEMVLPFFYFKNNLSVTTGGWGDMGKIVMRTLNELKHANGSVDAISINVFAHMEDAHLSIPTSQNPASIVPQAGDESDEAQSGKLSTLASNTAKIASALSVVPQIAPYAKATAAGATATATVLKNMGYSAPTYYTPPMPYRPQITDSLATCNTPVAAQKLAIDGKNEVSIDPRITGLKNDDPMAIQAIAGRESYLTTFPWAKGSSPETLLFNIKVNPGVCSNSGVVPVAFHLPPIAVASMPFEYWTGSIDYRFQVVCSEFHKGRLRFVYEPDTAASTDEFNVAYNEVIDISECRDVTMKIGLAQEQQYLQVAHCGGNLASDYYGTSAFVSDFPASNGVLSVYVLNELTTPNSTVDNDIEVNVFVSAGEDFKLAVPSMKYVNFSVKPQSGAELQSGNDEDDEMVTGEALVEHANAPVQETSNSFAVGLTGDDKLNLAFMGESISNFRELIKRYNLHTSYYTPLASRVILAVRHPSWPYLKGRVNGAVNEDSGAVPYSYCNTTLLNWLSFYFQGFRGSMRWKYMARDHAGSMSGRMSAERVPFPLVTAYADYSAGSAVPTTPSKAAFNSVVQDNVNDVKQNAVPGFGGRGLGVTHAEINPVLDIEIPYYSPFYFNPGKKENYTGSSETIESLDFKMYGVLDDIVVDTYVAAGEDFQFLFPTGTPRLYYEPTPPTPAT